MSHQAEELEPIKNSKLKYSAICTQMASSEGVCWFEANQKIFLYNAYVYKQINRVIVGFLLGPILTIFDGSHEKYTTEKAIQQKI